MPGSPALRTDAFRTITPKDKVNSRADNEAYTPRFLERIDHFISLDFQIGTIDVQGDLASAYVTQKTVRMQRLPDGPIHEVEADAVQRETWKETAEGWQMQRLDNVRRIGLFVDDKPYKPGNRAFCRSLNTCHEIAATRANSIFGYLSKSIWGVFFLAQTTQFGLCLISMFAKTNFLQIFTHSVYSWWNLIRT